MASLSCTVGPFPAATSTTFRADGVASGLLVFAGAYVAWYGWYEVRILRGGDGSDPIINRGIAVQTWLQDKVIPDDPVVAVGVIVLVLAVVAGLAALRARGRQEPPEVQRLP